MVKDSFNIHFENDNSWLLYSNQPITSIFIETPARGIPQNVKNSIPKMIVGHAMFNN